MLTDREVGQIFSALIGMARSDGSGRHVVSLDPLMHLLGSFAHSTVEVTKKDNSYNWKITKPVNPEEHLVLLRTEKDRIELELVKLDQMLEKKKE